MGRPAKYKTSAAKKKKINGYVRLAEEQGLNIPHVQAGFELFLPRELEADFLTKMEEKGWIRNTTPVYHACALTPGFMQLHLLPRYEYIMSKDGRYCLKRDKLSNKHSTVDYLLDD